MVRILFGVALAMHGLLHLIGFVVPFRLARVQGFAYSTTAAWGHVELGDRGARAVGVGWLVAAMAFSIAAGCVLANAPAAPEITAAAASLSLMLSIVGAPAALVDLAIDVVILAIVVAVRLEALEFTGQ